MESEGNMIRYFVRYAKGYVKLEITQSKNIINLQRQIESAADEITALTNENNDAMPKMRMKLTKTIQDYDTKLNDIVSTHDGIKTKLEVLFDFTKTMEDKLNTFNSVMESNKKLIDKIAIINNIEIDLDDFIEILDNYSN